MAVDNSSAPQKSPLPPNNSTPSPPPEKSSPSPPPPSKSSSSPPPPRKSPTPAPPSNDGNKNGDGKSSPSTPNQSSSDENQTPESPSPPDSSNDSPSGNEQSESPPEEQQSPETPNLQSPPPPPPGDKATPSSSTSESVPVPSGKPNSPAMTVSPTRPSPKQASNNSLTNYPGSSSSSEGPPPPTSASSLHKSIIIGAVAGTFVVFVVMIIICSLCLRRKKRKPDRMPPYGGWEHGLGPPGNNQFWKASQQEYTNRKNTPTQGGGNINYDSCQQSGPPMSPSLAPSPGLTLGFNRSEFTYDELAAATNGFDKANILGQGGFGYVHKGVFPNGKEIAVKCLKSGSGQGEREFQAEVEIISRVHHRYLVSLVGYCIANGQRMLVYEFVSNNTLEYHLHEKTHPTLDFPTRLRIALGSAKGLSYLHEDCHPRIIHRDIKASNILLDDNFEAMVADFGLAKLTDGANTHVSTRVMGTFGYLAPEYASSGKLTEKSDVFSFGVMLLELITGRRPVDPDMKYMEDCLVDWARPLLTKAGDTGNYDELVDPRLETNYNPNEMQRMVACAAASIRHSAKKRPKMSKIVRVLEGDVSLEDLNEGVKPGQSTIHASSEGSDYDTRQYSADLKRFRQMAFESRDFGTNEYGVTTTTSEYGLNSSGISSESSKEVK